MSRWVNTGRDESSVPIMGTTQSVGKSGRWKVSSYANGRGEALPWGLVLVEGIVVALFGLILLVAPGASLERVMNLGKSRIEMRISRSAWFPRDLCFLHS